MHRPDIRPPGDDEFAPARWRSHCPSCRTWWGAETEAELKSAAKHHETTGRWPS